ncbi:hypothetical protein ES703_12108 [subsurface metagenome]
MMADIEVLTKDTTQITAGKKYSARPPAADEDAFLAEMGSHRTDEGHISNATKAGLALAAIDFAPTRAECAGIHTIPQLLNGLTKRTDISRQKRHSFVFRISYFVCRIMFEVLLTIDLCRTIIAYSFNLTEQDFDSAHPINKLREFNKPKVHSEQRRDSLARRLRTGEHAAATELVDIYYKQIYLFMRRLGHDRQVSEDVVWYGDRLDPKDSGAVLMQRKLPDGKYEVMFVDRREREVNAEELIQLLKKKCPFIA